MNSERRRGQPLSFSRSQLTWFPATSNLAAWRALLTLDLLKDCVPIPREREREGEEQKRWMERESVQSGRIAWVSLFLSLSLNLLFLSLLISDKQSSPRPSRESVCPEEKRETERQLTLKAEAERKEAGEGEALRGEEVEANRVEGMEEAEAARRARAAPEDRAIRGAKTIGRERKEEEGLGRRRKGRRGERQHEVLPSSFPLFPGGLFILFYIYSESCESSPWRVKEGR